MTGVTPKLGPTQGVFQFVTDRPLTTALSQARCIRCRSYGTCCMACANNTVVLLSGATCCDNRVWPYEGPPTVALCWCQMHHTITSATYRTAQVDIICVLYVDTISQYAFNAKCNNIVGTICMHVVCSSTLPSGAPFSLRAHTTCHTTAVVAVRQAPYSHHHGSQAGKGCNQTWCPTLQAEI